MLANVVRRSLLCTHILNRSLALSTFKHKHQGGGRKAMADESAGDDEGDGDIDKTLMLMNIRNENSKDDMTMEEYKLHRTHKKFAVRQLPSRGLSFKVWPAASALCWLLDEMVWHYPAIITCSQPETTIPKCTEPEKTRPKCHEQGKRMPKCTEQENGRGNDGCEMNLEVDHIAHQLLERRGDRLALRVLELGAGTGMVGIALSLLGAHVTITDLPHVIPNLEFNASANEEAVGSTGLGGTVCVKALRWGEEEDALEVGPNVDLVLASDVVYHENLFDPLLLTLKWLLLSKTGDVGNPIMLMAHLRRWKKEAWFFKKAKKLFDVKVVHGFPPSPGSRLGVVVYCFTKK